MHRLCLSLVLISTLCGVNGQSDEKTDCSKMDFTDLPKDCCKKPYGSVFSPDKFPNLKECKSNAKLLDWANAYKLNSLQDQDIKNFVNVESKSTIKDLCTAGAFMECFFKKQEWVNASGVIDYGAVSKSLQDNAPDAEWRTIVSKMMNPLDPMQSTSYPFTDIVEDKFEKITCSGANLNLLPLMMAQMIQSELVWMCPQQAQYTAKNKCTDKMKNYQFCDGKIYSPLAKGIFFFPSV